MNIKEAKILLKACRPGTTADGDPRIAEALELAGRDPALGAWFEEQCALYATVKAKLEEIPVPDDLKDRILSDRKVVRPALWTRRRIVLVAAAALVLLVAIAALCFRAGTNSDLRVYRRDMVQFIADLYRMNVQATTWEGLQKAFAKQGWPSDYVVPNTLQSVSLEGGCMLIWRDEKVSLICMKSEKKKGLWLFVMNRTGLPASASKEKPQYGKVGKLSTATWSQGDKTYLLATEGDAADLRNRL
jgi:hypothetical protein